MTYLGENGRPWTIYATKSEISGGKPTTKNDGSGELLPNASVLWVIDAAESGETTMYMFDAATATWYAQG